MKERKSNIELLRIISILLIISFHYVYKGGLTFEKFCFNEFLVKIFWMFGELGVNLFILITGYFLSKGKISYKKIIYLILEINFYHLILTFIGIKLNIKKITGIKQLICSFFPTLFNQYWFITAYIIIYLMAPYFNILIESMEKRVYKKFIIITLLLWCIIPTIFGILYNSTETLLYYNRLIWLIIMYFVGAYMRIHSINLINTKKKSLIVSSVSFLLMLISILVIGKFNIFFKKVGTTEIAYFWRPNTILMFLLSISIFKIFLDIDIKNNRIINKIASTTLGIYIIHDSLLNKYIFYNIFKSNTYENSKFLILNIIYATFVIFVVCVIIDLIRQLIEKYIVKKILESKTIDRFSNKINKLGEQIENLL